MIVTLPELISLDELARLAETMKQSEYGRYLLRVLDEEHWAAK